MPDDRPNSLLLRRAVPMGLAYNDFRPINAVTPIRMQHQYVVDAEILMNAAEQVDLDPVELKAALDTHLYAEGVIDAVNQARQIGITNTPTLFLAGPASPAGPTTRCSSRSWSSSESGRGKRSSADRSAFVLRVNLNSRLRECDWRTRKDKSGRWCEAAYFYARRRNHAHDADWQLLDRVRAARRERCVWRGLSGEAGSYRHVRSRRRQRFCGAPGCAGLVLESRPAGHC